MITIKRIMISIGGYIAIVAAGYGLAYVLGIATAVGIVVVAFVVGMSFGVVGGLRSR